MNVITVRSSMVWTPVNLVRGVLTLNKDSSGKGLKGKEELLGIEPRANGSLHQCSATDHELKLPLATTPLPCSYVACSSLLLIDNT